MDVQGWVLIGLAVLLFGYLVPHLVTTRQQLADSRVEDRFSTGLRVVRAGASPARSSPSEHHGESGNRPYLHDPRRRTEGPVVNRPTTPGERAAAEARRLAAARAARAAEISRRQAAARRRLVLTIVLLLASVGGWAAFGVASMTIALGIAPTVLLGAVLVAGRRAAKVAARRNAADRAAMARLEVRPEARPRTALPAAGATPLAVREQAVGPAAAEGAPAQGSAASAGGPAVADVAAQRSAASSSVRTGRAEGASGEEPSAAPGAGDRVEDAAGARQEPGGDVDDAHRGQIGTAGTARPESSGDAGTSSDSAEAWTPVRVPAPAYTLKPSAPRRDVAPYEAPEPAPAPAAPAAGNERAPAPAPVAVVEPSGLAGSPYAPVTAAEVEAQAAVAPLPETVAGGGIDLDSVLARRRALGA